MIGYRQHETGNNPRMRIWNSNWPGDMFNTVSQEHFQIWRTICDAAQLNIVDLDLLDEDEIAAIISVEQEEQVTQPVKRPVGRPKLHKQ